jgi:glycosyltransferase involved in cell wall biosynthesis
VGRFVTLCETGPMLAVTIVAHDIGSLGGGMEVALSELVTGLLDAGVDVTVIARRCELPAHERLTVHRVRTPARPFPLAYPLFAVAGTWAVRRHARGIVHATGAVLLTGVDCVTVHFCHAAYEDHDLGPRPAAPGRMFALNARIASLMSVWGERWSYARSRTRAVITTSAGVTDEMSEYFPALTDRLTMIPHGVDTARFRPDPDVRQAMRSRLGLRADGPVAVFVGGDWPRKGLEHAIDAVAQTTSWTLLVVGHGHRAAYEQQARDLSLGDRVRFVGETREVAAHLAAADVFLLPTRYETFCLVAFEAAAAGLPLLVTQVSGPDILIEPGVNGEFLDGDVRRTARLLDAYLDPARRRAHGDSARARAGEFSWERATAAHLDIYRSLAAAPGS